MVGTIDGWHGRMDGRKITQTWTTKPNPSQIQTGVRGRKVFDSVDHSLWNTIPTSIRSKPSLARFKKTMFDHFKDSYT